MILTFIAVDSVMGGGSNNHAPAPVPQQTEIPKYQVSAGPCDLDQRAFFECLQNNQNNASNCDFYYNALQSCQARN